MTVYNDVLNTLLVANGIYIAGTTAQEFDANAASVYNDFSAYYTLQNNVSQSELEAILAGSYTNGNIDLSALTAAGITGAFPGFAAVLMSQGTATGGATSLDQVGNLTINGNFTFNSFDSFPYNNSVINEWILDTGGRWNLPYIPCYRVSGNEVRVYLARSLNFVIENQNVNAGTVRLYQSSDYATMEYADFEIESTGTTRTYRNGYASVLLNTSEEWYLNSGITVTGNNSIQAGVASGGHAAVIADGVTAGTFAGTNQGLVQAFEPTAEQLQAGYDYTVLIDSGSISGKILTTDNMLEALMAYDTNLMGVIDAKIDAALGSIINGSY